MNELSGQILTAHFAEARKQARLARRHRRRLHPSLPVLWTTLNSTDTALGLGPGGTPIATGSGAAGTEAFTNSPIDTNVGTDSGGNAQ